MKKTFIALAALAATAGVAHAQSSVTLYGIADAYVGVKTQETTGLGAVAKVRNNRVDSNGLSSSRWGLRGSEDLGGGLAAVFTLENGFSIDTGNMKTDGNGGGATQLFSREANVGLKGNFGEVRLGRQYSAYDDLHGAINNTWDSASFATTGKVAGTGLQDYSSRVNNAISYASPVFSGFSGRVVYGFGEDKGASNSASNSASLRLQYANGPLLVGYAFQREKSASTVVGSNLFTFADGPRLTDVGSAAVAGTRKYHQFGGSYDFGVAKLVGSYVQAKGDAVNGNNYKDKEYQLGVVVPFGAAALAVGYSHAKSDSQTAVADSNKGTGFSLAGTYSLSKRTDLYAGYANFKSQSNNGATEDKKQTFGLGLRHKF